MLHGARNTGQENILVDPNMSEMKATFRTLGPSQNTEKIIEQIDVTQLD